MRIRLLSLPLAAPEIREIQTSNNQAKQKNSLILRTFQRRGKPSHLECDILQISALELYVDSAENGPQSRTGRTCIQDVSARVGLGDIRFGTARFPILAEFNTDWKKIPS